jgi:hypothetical protein
LTAVEFVNVAAEVTAAVFDISALLTIPLQSTPVSRVILACPAFESNTSTPDLVTTLA